MTWQAPARPSLASVRTPQGQGPAPQECWPPGQRGHCPGVREGRPHATRTHPQRHTGTHGAQRSLGTRPVTTGTAPPHRDTRRRAAPRRRGPPKHSPGPDIRACTLTWGCGGRGRRRVPCPSCRRPQRPLFIRLSARGMPGGGARRAGAARRGRDWTQHPPLPPRAASPAPAPRIPHPHPALLEAEHGASRRGPGAGGSGYQPGAGRKGSERPGLQQILLRGARRASARRRPRFSPRRAP